MQTSIVKWHYALISRHKLIIAYYLRIQNLLPSTKMQLTRCVPDGIILQLSGLPKTYSNSIAPYIGIAYEPNRHLTTKF